MPAIYHHNNDQGSRLPTLFLDLDGTNRVKDAGESIGKKVVEEENSQLLTLFEKGLKKDTIYYSACDSETIYEKINQLQSMQTYFRLGINLPSYESELLEQLFRREVSIILASDRVESEWCSHFQRSQEFLVYVDPWFQPRLIERYQSIHDDSEDDPEQELKLNEEKARLTLSDAEVRVFEKILEGKSNRKIAEECFLAVATVNNHVSHLTRKMGANDRTHTIKRAIEEGWVHIL
ncbi:DNA-binding NarL/FixJ family response regulator [Salibacterium salarium]|uniref:response regulator transcription factor n=1 Tax=Salibacterium salarium TaxID=284579 RepID=UPI00277F5A23|nr:LuxR C-terminal-related transcriptional regulator [Salibacterium salarium]MDQ0298219.1 DNA-binding NarL/FixJ family response regulator [Salibacterium salarium]